MVLDASIAKTMLEHIKELRDAGQPLDTVVEAYPNQDLATK